MPHPARKVPALAAAALCLLGLGAGSALASPAAHQTPKVPWNKVGPGWAVVQYSTGTIVPSNPDKSKAGSEILYLTSPENKKYRIYSRKNAGLPLNLVDWSGDGQRVLLSSQFDPTATDNVEQISLATGKVTARFTWPGSVSPIGYTKPDGLNILAISRIGDEWQLQRYNLQGQLQKVLASGDSLIYPDSIYTPDGNSLITPTSSGLEEVSNLGGVTARFKAPAKVAVCYPQRWWNSATVLADCYPGSPLRSRLWLVNIKTAKWSPLSTPARGAFEINAWQIKSGIYMQDDISCEFIGQQFRNGSTHVVKVPGNGGAVIATGMGTRLLVAAQRVCEQAGTSLVWFNPATKSVSYVLRPTGHTIGVQTVIAFGGRAAIS